MADDPTPSSPKPAPSTGSGQAGIARFWAELRRRKVRRVAITYIVVAWLVIQVAVSTFPKLLIPQWAESLVIMCVILGFPVAIVLAWAFELTPDGIKTTKAATEETEVSESHKKKRNWISFLFGAAVPTLIFSVLAIFLYFRSGGDSEESTGEKSIAILPFDNRSNREEDLFFTDGVHDDLLTQISKIGDIRTVARTSVMAYRDTTESMKTIGEELNVSTLLEGGVQRSGNQIRINVKLFDAVTNTQKWAATYTRELTAENVFKIQSEISLAIADSLHALLSPAEKERLEKLPTENLAALEAYFKGVEHQARRSSAGYEEAIIHFEKAISLDPNFALAHANLARSILDGMWKSGLPFYQETAKAEPHVLKSLELDDTLSEGYIALGSLTNERRDYEAAGAAFKRAVELAPSSAAVYNKYAAFLKQRSGETQEVASLLRKAYELNPKDESALDRLASSYEALGQWGNALEPRESFAALNPNSATAYHRLGNLYSDELGRFDDAIAAYRKSHFLDPNGTQVINRICHAYISLGDQEQSVWWIDRLLKILQNSKWKINRRAMMLKIKGDDTQREVIALEGLNQYPEHLGSLQHLTDIDLASGHPEKSRARWELAYPSLFDPSVEIYGTPSSLFGTNNFWIAKDLARVLMATEESAQANYLITESLARVRSMVPRLRFRLLEVSLHAIAGDDRQALETMRRYFDAGGSPYDLMWNDELKRFETNPEYQAMAEKRKAEFAVQLERIRKMEANGELAPIPELPAN